MRKKRVLFLCTGNSCRSQMAEGLINRFMSDTWQACSAGTAPVGYVHPLAIKAMSKLGIDLSKNTSRSTDELTDVDFDLVVTVCDDAAENCPTYFSPEKQVHFSFPDPARATGTEAERLLVFEQVRDDIQQTVFDYLRKN